MTIEAVAPPPDPVDWRRNLAALWFAEFTAIFGFSFAFPFLPVFLHTDLGVENPHQLALWTGLAGSASGFALAIASPIWGAVGDRFGRKPMLVRAMVGGGIAVGLMSLAQNPVQLVVLRFVQGASSGTIAACNALVATETPRARVGWALGVLTSSVALGGALGPLAGGLAGAAFGLRAIFAAGGVLLLLSTIPVLLLVRESPRIGSAEGRTSALAALRAQRPGAVRAVAVLLASMTLYYTFVGALQPLAVLRLVELVRSGATAISGVAFGAFGLTQSIAAALYSGLALRLGYRKLAGLVAGGSALVLLGMAHAATAVLVVLCLVGLGLLVGSLGPSLSSMLGLESPPGVQARVFGVGSSATALGFAFGPLLGGGLAGAFDVPAGITGAAVIAALLTGVLATAVREPAR
ncbi:MAG TPA: MFS transporter [Candidatus Dormibacteraeota bacterium]